MSLVGNFAFNNYDRTSQSAGAGSNYRPGFTSYGQSDSYLGRILRRGSTASRHSTEAAISQGTDYPTTKYDPNQEFSSEDEAEQFKDLARKLTRATTTDQRSADPWHYEEGSALDPNSDNFRAKAFIKAMLDLQSREGRNLGRTAGISFRNLSCHGYGSGTDYQQTVGNTLLQVYGGIRARIGGQQNRVDILRNFDGLVEAGEMLVVLGPPGSGCSTFLKTITGETHGFVVDKESQINYQGISFEQMHNHFRGEAIYTAEQDVHFPQLTVGDTLYFAARARAPQSILGHISVREYATHMRNVLMATFGIRHTMNTKVGNDFIRGVSGGERKRVSIAEACLNGSPLQAWDNSTRGLDSANAIEFCKTIRTATELLSMTAAVAIYQAPQAAYDYFDKVLVLYEGRQIFFGRADQAKQYFVELGWSCPDRQTTADFLTSMTSTLERTPREGFETKVPRTPDEFAERWNKSLERAALLKEIEAYEKEHPLHGEDLEKFQQSMSLQKSKRQRSKSPYTLSYIQQINLCLWRGFRRLVADPSLTITQLLGNFIMALITGSVFYDLDVTTNSFFSRGALIFFAILMNAFGSALEILTLYAQRPIVEKHSRYALYHPSAEAFASMLTDIPYKTVNAFTFNIPLYFMTNLRREAGPFFFFLLISFFLTLVMSMLFRTIASVSRTLSQALAPAAVLILAIVIYTGFTIPTRDMLSWSRWINYVNPIAYGFESLLINEFHGRFYDCAVLVPSGPGYGAGLDNKICTTVGSKPGQTRVSGDAFINLSYQYYASHKWRNFGFMIVFMIALMFSYLAAAEYISAKKSKGEVLIFRRGHIPAALKNETSNDPEAAATGRTVPTEKQSKEQDVSTVIQRQTAIFQWHNVCYDIKIKNEDRRILDHVDGWVKPGTLTALMGVSGAGKTTLLDVLATRVTMGVITGEMLVDGRQRDSSFQRKTGYVQQQDLHLATSTVREALNFSAILRQPAHVPRQEKLTYVQEVIKLLEMEEYADAVVGVPGEGLNVEQRKRLTIGVELAAKPQLLLFLDEPTSGLDSQTSWSILDLLEKLKNNGQAILCTIHQPSAMLFQRFDRLLFLAKGGRTVYFGPVGEGSKILTKYFERNGAFPCPDAANPAEWMLEIIGAAPGSHSDVDWPATWRSSPEIKAVHEELEQMKNERSQMVPDVATSESKAQYREFGASFLVQLYEVQLRVFQQYWRTPSYIYSKLFLVTASGMFIGFSFYMAKNSMQGLQNQMFSIFMMMTIFGQVVQQIMPLFVTQRALYEVRERPSKTYSWQAFMMSNLFAEIPWSTACAVLLFFTWYYPIGLYRNCTPTDTVHERGVLMFLFIWIFLVFTSTFAHMVIAGIDSAETGGNIANLAFTLTLIFCGVLASPTALPGFWIFMYRVSPFTYIIEGMLTTAVADTVLKCADYEYLRFAPPSGKTCAEYLGPFVSAVGGYLEQGTAQSTEACSYCRLSTTNAFLKGVASDPANMWRDWGIMWSYVIFNVCGAIVIYWLVRVPKGAKKDKKTKTMPAAQAQEKNEELPVQEPAKQEDSKAQA